MPTEEFYHVLTALAPAFEHPADGVSFLSNPEEFHSTVLDMIRASKKSLIISSLYIGCSEAEKDEYAQEIVSSLREKLNSPQLSPEYSVKILVDGTRSSRKNYESTLVLEQIKNDHPALDIQVHPLVVPSSYHRIRSLFTSGGGEALSNLQHMKFVVSDDNVLLTGANLSKEYFTTRKDRYLLIRNSAPLSSFYLQLTSLVIESTHEANLLTTRDKVLRLVKLDTESSSFELLGGDVLKEDSVYLFPSVQIPWLGIRQEESIITTLLGMARNLALPIHLSTAYFNLSPKIKQFLLCNEYFESSYASTVLTSSPECNSFFNAQWPKNLIPVMYEKILNEFTTVSDYKVFKYHRPGWTFHAKGLYLSTKDDTIFLTQIGSSNYGLLDLSHRLSVGYRSFEKDLECQLTLLTKNPGLQREFSKDLAELHKFAVPVIPPAPASFSVVSATKTLFLNGLSRLCATFL